MNAFEKLSSETVVIFPLFCASTCSLSITLYHQPKTPDLPEEQQGLPSVEFFTAIFAILDGQPPTLPPDHPYAAAIAAIQEGIARGGLRWEDDI